MRTGGTNLSDFAGGHGMLRRWQVAAGADYKVIKTWKLGGDGGWDYLTADSDGHRLFISRATRVMVD